MAFLAALLALALAAFLPATASAVTPVEVDHFACEAGNECNGATSWTPGRLAVDEESGDVYVIDEGHDAIQKFSGSGTYLGQLTVPAGEGGTFSWSGETDVAVDNSGGANAGSVYAETENGWVYAFDSSGNFKWKSNEGISDVCGVAVDPSGNPWYGDFNEGLKQLDPVTGEEVDPSREFLKTGTSCHFAFFPDGSVALNAFDDGISKYSAAGTLLDNYEPADPAADVAVDASNEDVYAATATSGSPISRWHGGHEPVDSERFGSDTVGVTVDAAHHQLFASHGSEVTVYATGFPLVIHGTGSGRVVTCNGGACESEYGIGETVQLEAVAGSGYVLAGWIGCTPSGATTCEVTIESETQVTAVFIPTVTVTPVGLGEGCANGGLKVESAGSEEFVCNGSDGTNGSNGASGAQGPQGPAGVNGKDGTAGAPGPQGPAGKQGPPGKVTCKVKQKGKKVKVTCKVKQPSSAGASRLRWRLTRHGRSVEHGTARRGRLRLGVLPRGHYRLHVEGRSTTDIVVG
jgi:hypothetical protein